MTTMPRICGYNLLWEGPNGDGICHAVEGQLHAQGCPFEWCSQCGGQYLYCKCADAMDEDMVATDSDPRPRVPFIRYPLLCGRCGDHYPEFFNVPDDVWKHYIEIKHRDDIICRYCFEDIAEMIDSRAYEQEHGTIVMLSEINENAAPGSEARRRWESWDARREEWRRNNQHLIDAQAEDP
jgi:hypothetical protein